jgi:hypothetical protein
VVVHEVDQIAQHQQRIGTLTRSGQRIHVPVYVGHHVDPHVRQATGADRCLE